MDFISILKRSWEIVSKNRWLWWLGFLAGFTEVGGSTNLMSNVDFPFSDSDLDKIIPGASPSPVTSPVPTETNETAQVLGDMMESFDITGLGTIIGHWLSDNWMIVLWLFIASIVLWLVVLYASYSARAGLILSARSLEDHDKKIGFRKAFHEGRSFSWRLFGLQIVTAIVSAMIVILSLVIFGVPALLVGNATAPLLVAALWGIVGIIVMILVLYATGMAYRYAEQAMVLEDEGIFDALAEGYGLFRHNMRTSVKASVVMAIVGIVFGTVVAFLFVPIIFFIGAVGLALYSTLGLVSTIALGIIGSLLLILVLGILGGFYGAYLLTYWTIVYKKLHGSHHAAHHKAS